MSIARDFHNRMDGCDDNLHCSKLLFGAGFISTMTTFLGISNRNVICIILNCVLVIYSFWRGQLQKWWSGGNVSSCCHMLLWWQFVFLAFWTTLALVNLRNFLLISHMYHHVINVMFQELDGEITRPARAFIYSKEFWDQCEAACKDIDLSNSGVMSGRLFQVCIGNCTVRS